MGLKHLPELKFGPWVKTKGLRLGLIGLHVFNGEQIEFLRFFFTPQHIALTNKVYSIKPCKQGLEGICMSVYMSIFCSFLSLYI